MNVRSPSSSVTPRTRPRVRSLRSLLPPENINETRIVSPRPTRTRASGTSPRRGAPGMLERKRRTPLMIASSHGSVDVLGYLLRVGADVSARSEDDERCTAMHCAASGGSALASEAIKLLLLFGADRAALNACGRVPARRSPGRHGRILREFVGHVTPARATRTRTVGRKAAAEAETATAGTARRAAGTSTPRLGARAVLPRRRTRTRRRVCRTSSECTSSKCVGVRGRERTIGPSVRSRTRGRRREGAIPAISLFGAGVSRVSKGVVSARRRVRIPRTACSVLAPSEQVPHATV